MPLHPRRTAVVPPPPEDAIQICGWTVRVWSKLIGNNAGRFTATATNDQGKQLIAHGLSHTMALDKLTKQMPAEERAS